MSVSREVPYTYYIFEDIVTATVPPTFRDLRRLHPGIRKLRMEDAIHALMKSGLIRHGYGKGKSITFVPTQVGVEAAVLFGQWEQVFDREGIPEHHRA